MFAWIIIVIIVLIVAFTLLLISLYPDNTKQALENKYAQAPSRFIDINGTRVHYRDEGRGPAVVLLHGVFSSLHTWDGWVEALSANFRMVRLDLPGWGLTGKAAFNYSITAYTDFLHDFLTAVGVEKCVLVGNSFGGMVSWNYAIQYPDQVEKLILIDAVGYPAKKPAAIKAVSIPGISFLAERITPKSILIKITRGAYGNPKNIKQDILDRYYELIFYPQSRNGHLKIADMIFRELRSGWQNIKKVSVPTLIMWGSKDRWVRLSAGHRFNRDIKHSTLIVYDDAGHLPMEENPVQSARDAQDFIQGP